jgi:hypothetical protein
MLIGVLSRTITALCYSMKTIPTFWRPSRKPRQCPASPAGNSPSSAGQELELVRGGRLVLRLLDVHATDPVAAIREVAAQVMADEPTGSGDENKEGLKKVCGSGSPPSDMAILMISPSSPFS